MSQPVQFNDVKLAERKAIRKRRSQHLAGRDVDADLDKPVGLAISGGGVRSASFGLGVVQALDEHGRFKDIDYLSSVSGGSYLGGYIATMALDSAVPRGGEHQADSSEDVDETNGQAEQAKRPENHQKSAEERVSITPLVTPPGQPQNERVRRLVYKGDYLRSPLGFLNRYVFGLILINVFFFSGILMAGSGLAWLFRWMDRPTIARWLRVFHFETDLNRAFFPATVVGALWLIAWGLSYWSALARKCLTPLFGALIAFILIAFAALLGTGDIDISYVPKVLTVPAESDDLNSLSGWLRVLVLAPLILFIIPYLNPRRFLRSGLSPKATFLERMTFKIVSMVVLIGIPLLVFGYLARENVSGFNDDTKERDGTLYRTAIRDWSPHTGNAPFWERMESEARRVRALIAGLPLGNSSTGNGKTVESGEQVVNRNGGRSPVVARKPNRNSGHVKELSLNTDGRDRATPFERFRIKVREIRDELGSDWPAEKLCHTDDPTAPDGPPKKKAAAAVQKPEKKPSPGALDPVTQCLLAKRWVGTEFLSYQLWHGCGTIEEAIHRHPDLPIRSTIARLHPEMEKTILGHEDQKFARIVYEIWPQALRSSGLPNPREYLDRRDALDRRIQRDLRLADRVGIEDAALRDRKRLPEAIPHNLLLRQLLIRKTAEIKRLEEKHNPHFYSAWLMAGEAAFSHFVSNSSESENEELLRLYRLHMDVTVIRTLMVENLNAALRDPTMLWDLPLDSELIDSSLLRFDENLSKTLGVLRVRAETVMPDIDYLAKTDPTNAQKIDEQLAPEHSITGLNRQFLNTAYPDLVHPPKKVFATVVLEADQEFRRRFFWWSLGVFLVSGFFVNLRATSPHAYFRRQLQQTWLSDQQAFPGDIPLSQVRTTSEGYPYVLIAATANYLRLRKDQEHKGATDLFLFSRLYCGSDCTGYLSTNDYHGGTYDLASAMAVSAGAISPAQVKNPFVRLMSMLLNLRLGEWLPNPGYQPPKLLKWLVRKPVPFVVAPSALSSSKCDRTAFSFVTDGGHHENLGVAALLHRRCRLIICVDSSRDPYYEFADFAAMERRMRIDEGIRFSRIEFGPLAESMDSDHSKSSDEEKPDAAVKAGTTSEENDGDAGVSAEPPGLYELVRELIPPGARKVSSESTSNRDPRPRSIEDLSSKRHYVIFRVNYPEQDSPPGIFIYIKPTLTGCESPDLIAYAAGNREFPNDTTADQFYEPDKFESYRQLGYHIGNKLCSFLDTLPVQRLWQVSDCDAPTLSRTPDMRANVSIDHYLSVPGVDTEPAGRIVVVFSGLLDVLESDQAETIDGNRIGASLQALFDRLRRETHWDELEWILTDLKSRRSDHLKQLGPAFQQALLELFRDTRVDVELRARAGNLLCDLDPPPPIKKSLRQAAKEGPKPLREIAKRLRRKRATSPDH